MKRIIFYCLFISTLFTSCSKGKTPAEARESGNLFGNMGQIYFTIYVQDSIKDNPPGNLAPHDQQWYTGCFDLEYDTMAWLRPDSIPNINLANNFPSVSSYVGSYNLYSKDNALIRIYPTAAGYKDRISPVTSFDGVYFEKIDKRTGNILLLKKIVSAAQLNGQSLTSITNVIYDGDGHLYFGCNTNGTIYCADTNGNIVWQKQGYALFKYDGSPSYEESSLYYSTGKVLFVNADRQIVCLAGATGNELWKKNYTTSVKLGPLLYVTDKFVFFLSPQLKFTRANILTGNVDRELYTPVTLGEAIISDFKSNDSTLSFFSDDYKGNSFSLPYGLWMETFDVSSVNGRDGNYIGGGDFTLVTREYQGGLYGHTESMKSFKLFRMNPDVETDAWKISAPVDNSSHPLFVPTVYSWYFHNGIIYLIANFHFDHNQLIPDWDYNMLPASYAPIFGSQVNLIRIDAGSGAILSSGKFFQNPMQKLLQVYGGLVDQ